MKIPKRVYVSPYLYTVVMQKDLSAAAAVLGACMPDDLKILLDPGSPGLVMWETLFHESLHAIWSQTSLEAKFPNAEQEEIIYTLTPRLVALLRDNPELVAGIMEEE